jgi:hypothetical protein
MAVSLKTYYIPHTTRRKYGDFPTENISTSTNQGGGGAAGGGGGSSEYMTSFQTDNVSAGTWTVTGVYSLSNLLDGISIKVKFNTDSDSGLTANTIDLGIGAEGEAGTTFPKPIYITPGQLVTDEIKEGDELMLTYRSSLSGWVIDGSNERFARDLWEFYDSGTIISKYNVASSGDVMAFGAEDYTGFTEISVVDALTSSTTPHQNYALSAYQGKVLNEKFDTKQDLLESGTNIKTINGQSILGEGNIVIEGGGGTGGTEYYAGTGITIDTGNTISISQSTWDMIDDKYDKTGGTINGNVHATGTVSADGDVMSYGASSVVPSELSVINNLNSTSATDALSANMGHELSTMVGNKQDTLVSGTNIKTINNQSLLGSGNINIQGGGGTEYTGGTNIGISNYVISVTGTVQSAASATTAASANTAASADTASSATTAADSQKLDGHPGSYYATASQITDMADLLDDKYDKTGGTVNGNVIATGYVAASGDVMSYGASSAIPANLTVVDSLDDKDTTGTPHYNYALSAYRGKILKDTKQDKLIWTGSTNNIKTINGQSLQGPGNLVIQGGGGAEYTGGTNIGISNYVISVTGTVQNAATANASVRLGTGNTYHTIESLNLTLANKLGSNETAADSNKLGGVAAAGYAQTGGTYNNMTVGTAADSNKLGGVAASGYAQTGGTYNNMTVGTAANSDKVDGWHIKVGVTGSDANTLYFLY